MLVIQFCQDVQGFQGTYFSERYTAQFFVIFDNIPDYEDYH
jgi:hypothetical protein